MAAEEGEGSQLRTGGYELAVGGGEGGGAGRVLGSRQLARYYRQSYRPADARRSVAVASLVDQCAPSKETLHDRCGERKARRLTQRGTSWLFGQEAIAYATSCAVRC